MKKIIKTKQDYLARFEKLKERPLPSLEQVKKQWAASIEFSKKIK